MLFHLCLVLIVFNSLLVLFYGLGFSWDAIGLSLFTRCLSSGSPPQVVGLALRPLLLLAVVPW